MSAVLPGATFAAAVWVGLCAVYSAYVEYFTSFSATYGALTGVVVLEFWLYLSALIVVYGAELNAELMRHSWSAEQQELPIPLTRARWPRLAKRGEAPETKHLKRRTPRGT